MKVSDAAEFRQPALFAPPQSGILVPDLVDDLLAAGAVVAIGVSGGKDSADVAFETNDYLDAIGHTGPRILIHSDLEFVEWKDSLPTCQRLADATGLELAVVRRKAGGMLPRWLTRWDRNVERYRSLRCVKLILPWSTASMRFCTSELKSAVIASYLVKRFPGKTILSVSGIRREESTKRKKAKALKPQKRLTSKKHRTRGYDWNPILDRTVVDVVTNLERRGFALHEAYTRYGSSRVSCAFCILASAADLSASASCPDNHGVYRAMVDLEIRSTFAFQDGKWLGDVAPDLLDAPTRARLAEAKNRARAREQAEARIPKHLLYEKGGWPKVAPTADEAELLGRVRQDVAAAVGIAIDYVEPKQIMWRYTDLMFINNVKKAERAARAARKAKREADS